MRRFKIQPTRGWIVSALALLLISIAAGVGAAFAMPVKYTSNAQVVLISGTQDSSGHTANPFLQFSDSLNVTADLLSITASSDSSLDQIRAAGGVDTFKIARSAGSGAPILEITSTAPTASQAETTVRLVESQMRTNLADRQAPLKIPTTTLISFVTLTDVTAAQPSYKTPIEIGVIVFVGAVALSTVGLALLSRRLDRQRETETERFVRPLPPPVSSALDPGTIVKKPSLRRRTPTGRGVAGNGKSLNGKAGSLPSRTF